MFGFFKKDGQAQAPRTANSINMVAARLRMMGFDITSCGERVALHELESGYNDVEAASHIALTTLALDIKEAGTHFHKLMSFVPDGMAILEVLKQYKDHGLMHPAQWRNDSVAIYNVIKVNEHQEQWIERILNDCIAGEERLANSRMLASRGDDVPEWVTSGAGDAVAKI